MRNLRIDKEHEFDKEKKAVINELIGNEDQPWDLEGKAFELFGKGKPHALQGGLYLEPVPAGLPR